jgi:GMP synthase-like glutamine amidotransferase
MDKKILIIKHVEQEGPGMLGTFLEAAGWPIETLELGRGEALPESLGHVAAVIMLGGPMNVYEESAYSFLKDEDRLIKQVLKEEIPFLGICLGAQLLAKACGARVMKAAQKEIGWYSVDLTTEGLRDRLFRGVVSPLTVFQWHGDTFDVPEGGRLLCRSDVVPNQAFKVGSCAYGLQFHVEASQEMVEAWMREETSVDGEDILRQGLALRQTVEVQATAIFSNLKRLIESAARVKRVMKVFLDNKGMCRNPLYWDRQEKTLVPKAV